VHAIFFSNSHLLSLERYIYSLLQIISMDVIGSLEKADENYNANLLKNTEPQQAAITPNTDTLISSSKSLFKSFSFWFVCLIVIPLSIYTIYLKAGESEFIRLMLTFLIYLVVGIIGFLLYAIEIYVAIAMMLLSDSNIENTFSKAFAASLFLGAITLMFPYFKNFYDPFILMLYLSIGLFSYITIFCVLYGLSLGQVWVISIIINFMHIFTIFLVYGLFNWLKQVLL